MSLDRKNFRMVSKSKIIDMLIEQNKDFATAKDMLETSRAENELLKDELKSLSDSAGSVPEDNSEILKLLQEKENENKSLQEQLDILMGQMLPLNEDSVAPADYENALAAFEDTEKETEELKKQLAETKAKAAEERNALESRIAEIMEAHAAADKEFKDRENEEADELNNKNALLESSIAELTEKITLLESTVTELTEKNTSLADENSKLSSENAELNEKLESTKKKEGSSAALLVSVQQQMNELLSSAKNVAEGYMLEARIKADDMVSEAESVLQNSKKQSMMLIETTTQKCQEQIMAYRAALEKEEDE